MIETKNPAIIRGFKIKQFIKQKELKQKIYVPRKGLEPSRTKCTRS